MGDKNKDTTAAKKSVWDNIPVVDDSEAEKIAKPQTKSVWDNIPVVDDAEVIVDQSTASQEEAPTEEPTITIEQPQYLRPPVPVLKTEPEFFNPDVTQMKPIGVVQQPPKKLPYSEKLERRMPRTPEQIAQEQASAFDILAKDYAEDGMTLPGFIPPPKTQFIDPVPPINKITNPNGDPTYTAQYRNTKIGKLRDQLKNAAIYESGSEIELRPVIEKKIQEINSAAEKVIDLQLFNREYQQKKYTPEQAQTQIAAIQGRLKAEEEQYRQKVDAIFKKYPQASRNQDNLIDPRAADEVDKLKVQFNDNKKRYEQQQQQIISNSKYNMSMLGAEKEALFGNKQAQQDLANLKAGRPINPELKYKYDQIGRDIINEGLESTVNENVKKEATPYADVEGKQIKAQNKEFIKQKAKEDIGNRKYRDETVGNQILNAIIPSALRPDITPEQITKYAKEIGVDDDVAEELIQEKDSIPKEISLIQQFAKGFGNFLAPALYERAVRTVAFAQGKNVDEMFPPGWQEQRGIIAKIAGNMPTEQNTIHNIRGVAGAMANTIGMLQSFGPFAKMIAEPIAEIGVSGATSEKLANFGLMAFEGYNGAYQQAKDIVGDKPEDEWRRQLYSMTSGGLSALIFSAHPQSKYAITLSGEAKKTAEQFLNEIKNAGMKGLLTPKVVNKYANHIIEMAKMEGLVISQAAANKYAQNQLYNIAKPGTENDLAATEGLGEDVMHTALTFLIPSIMSGYGAAKQKTPLNKAAIFDVGTHAKEYTDWVYKQKAEGKMTGAQASQLVSDIAKIKAAQEDTPPVNDNGDLLTPDQIKNYTFSLLQERALQGRLDQLSREAKARNTQIDKAQEAPLKKQISELISERETILKSAGIPDVRPTQEPPIIPEVKEEVEVVEPAEEGVVIDENKPKENLVVSEEKDITLQPTTVTEDNTSQKPKENEDKIIVSSPESNEGRKQSTDNSQRAEVGSDTEVRSDTDAKSGQERQVLEPQKETEEPQRAPVNGEPAEVVSENKPKKSRRMFVEEEVVVPTPEQPVVEVKAEEITPKTPEGEVKVEEVTPEPKTPVTEKGLQSLQAKLDRELANPEPKTPAAQKAKKQRIENLQKQIENASTRLKEQQQKRDTEGSIQEPEGAKQARGEAKTPSPEGSDSVQRGKKGKQKVDNTPFGEAKSKANKRPKPKNEYQRLKQIATSGDPSSFYEGVLQAIVDGIRFRYDDIRTEYGIKHSDMGQYFRRIAKQGLSVDHFVERFLKSDDNLYNPTGFVDDAIDARREFFEIWQRYGNDERAALQELLRIQGKNEKGEEILPDFVQGESKKAEGGPTREELWAKLTPEQRNRYIESDAEMDLQDLVEDVVDAVEMTDAEAQIILDYAETLTEEDGNVNLTKPDLFDRDYQDAYNKLEALGKGKGKLLEFMISGEIADRYKEYDKIFEQYGIEKISDTPEGGESVSGKGEGVSENGKPSSKGEGSEQTKDSPAPEKAIEAKYDKVANKIEESLEAYLKRSAEQNKGMLPSAPGFSTRVGDEIVKAIAKATIALVRAGKNVHVAIYRAIEQVKANDPEGAKGLEYQDIDTLNKILSIVPERPKVLPELSKTNREIAAEWVSDIRTGELTYGQAVVEVMQAEGLKDATKENILNYMNFRLYKEAAHKIPHPEPKEGNMVAEMDMDESQASKFLGEKTTEDIYGEEGVADEMGEDKVALRLESIMNSARNTASAYKEKFGGLATKWGAKMFSDIKDVPNDPKRQATALVGLQAELQSERIRNEMDLKKLSSDLANNPTPENRQKILEAIEATTAEQQRLRALTAQVQNYWKKLASTSSDVLNIRRGDRMMRDAMMGDYYAERILNEQQIREMRAVEKALTADIMENYKNHPQYKAEMSIKKEKARSQARARREKKKQEQAEAKEGVVEKAKEKVKEVAEAITGNRKKEAEKRKEAARNDFPLNDKGERMTPKEFLEFIKKLKKPC